MFCLIFLWSHDVSKIWKTLFWPRVHRWEKWGLSGKMPPGGRAEIENVKYAKCDIFNFNSTTRWHFWTFTPLFRSMEHCPKKYHSDTLSINKFHWNFAPCISGILKHAFTYFGSVESECFRATNCANYTMGLLLNIIYHFAAWSVTLN